MSGRRGDISGLLQQRQQLPQPLQQLPQPPPSGGDIAGMAQAVRPQPALQPDLGPAAEIPYGQVQGTLSLLPAFQGMGANRPFGPGESIALPNGSIANEMTYTVPLGNRWAVVPGLWLMNGVPTHLTEDQAADMALRSGLQWPFTYDTVEQADAYARQREDFWQQNQDTTQQPPLWAQPAR